jgi:metallophosphoesterase (TIGR00282 family)
MQVNLLCVGDVVGAPGRHILREGLPKIVAERGIDCVIVNAENVAGGSGLTAALYEKIINYGADLVTLGDHIYRRRDIIPVLERSDKVVRPANLPSGAPGREFAICQTASSHRVAAISLLGRMFMKPPTNCPFAAVDRALAAMPKDVKIVVVDMHAEATSEKVAMGWHLDGRVSVVFGTHTHVPTADECILPKGTAYITDLGMTGPYDSVLGRDKDRVVSSMITGVPTTFDVAVEDPRLCGIVVSVDAETGKAASIERICLDGIPDSETA